MRTQGFPHTGVLLSLKDQRLLSLKDQRPGKYLGLYCVIFLIYVLISFLSQIRRMFCRWLGLLLNLSLYYTSCFLYMIWYDHMCVCVRVCVCVCTRLLDSASLRSAPDWIKVLLGCGCAPFGKSGFGFEIEAQGEALCHPQEGRAERYSSKMRRKREKKERGWESERGTRKRKKDSGKEAVVSMTNTFELSWKKT